MKNSSKKGLSQGGKKDHSTQLYDKALSRIEAEFISVLAKDRILELRDRGNWFSLDYLKLINLIASFRQRYQILRKSGWSFKLAEKLSRRHTQVTFLHNYC